jgi:hypothetical protein
MGAQARPRAGVVIPCLPPKGLATRAIRAPLTAEPPLWSCAGQGRPFLRQSRLGPCAGGSAVPEDWEGDGAKWCDDEGCGDRRISAASRCWRNCRRVEEFAGLLGAEAVSFPNLCPQRRSCGRIGQSGNGLGGSSHLRLRQRTGRSLGFCRLQPKGPPGRRLRRSGRPRLLSLAHRDWRSIGKYALR